MSRSAQPGFPLGMGMGMSPAGQFGVSNPYDPTGSALARYPIPMEMEATGMLAPPRLHFRDFFPPQLDGILSQQEWRFIVGTLNNTCREHHRHHLKRHLPFGQKWYKNRLELDLQTVTRQLTKKFENHPHQIAVILQDAGVGGSRTAADTGFQRIANDERPDEVCIIYRRLPRAGMVAPVTMGGPPPQPSCPPRGPGVTQPAVQGASAMSMGAGRSGRSTMGAAMGAVGPSGGQNLQMGYGGSVGYSSPNSMGAPQPQAGAVFHQDGTAVPNSYIAGQADHKGTWGASRHTFSM